VNQPTVATLPYFDHGLNRTVDLPCLVAQLRTFKSPNVRHAADVICRLQLGKDALRQHYSEQFALIKGLSTGHKINSDRTAAVALDAFWLPVGPSTPRGVSMWLINKASGVSTKGQYDTSDPFFDHWFPNPTFQKD
jgi:hypothetical protein